MPPIPVTEAVVWDVVFKAVAVGGAVIAALGATVAFFLTRYWNKRDAEASAREVMRVRDKEILYESLKWFEGRTQNRSIGIAVVSTSWTKYPEFRELWIEVLANQAIYLLTASKQADKQHEHENLRRIMEILTREVALLTNSTRIVLISTIEQKSRSTYPGGLELTSELLDVLDLALPRLKAAQESPV